MAPNPERVRLRALSERIRQLRQELAKVKEERKALRAQIRSGKDD